MHTVFSTIPKLARLLSGGNSLRFLINIFKLWLLIVVNELLHFEHEFTLACKFNGVEFSFCLKDKHDIAGLKDTFLEGEYEWNLADEPKVIIDLGAHIGDTALYYHCRYPDAIIYALEADPDIYDRLCKNVSFTDSIVPIHAAIAEKDGTIALNVSSRSSLGGSIMERKDIGSRVNVPAVTLETFFRTNELPIADIIKFDIEGAEKYMFLTNAPDRYAKAFIGELHCDLMGVALNDFLKHFDGYAVETVPLGRHGRYNIRCWIKTTSSHEGA